MGQTNKRGNPGKPRKTTRLNYAHELRGKHTVNRLEELKKKTHLQTVPLLFQITKMKNDAIPATLYRGGTGAAGAGEHGSHEALVRDHTLSGELKHPKNPQASQYTWHGLEWVVFTFGNIRR